MDLGDVRKIGLDMPQCESGKTRVISIYCQKKFLKHAIFLCRKFVVDKI